MRFELELTGDKATGLRLRGMGRRARDISPAGPRILNELRAGERRQFASNSGWSPDKPSTVAWKRRQHKDPRVERASGLLERVLTRPGQEGHGQIAKATRDSVTFGVRANSAVFYAKYQRNRVVVFAPRTQARVKGIVLDHVMGRLR